MAYKYITKYSGGNIDLVVGSANGTAINNAVTSATKLTLLGRNYTNANTSVVGSDTVVLGYGHYINQNFVDLLQNFANTHSNLAVATMPQANLIQGQLVSVTSDSRYVPARENRLFIAGSTNTYANSYANVQTGVNDTTGLTHANGGLIEVFTEKNPPSNMKSWIGTAGTTTDFAIDSTSGNITANVKGNLAIATVSPTGVTLGTLTQNSHLTLANGNAYVTGDVSISNALIVTNVIANTSNTIAVKANTITLVDTATVSNLTLTGGNLVLSGPLNNAINDTNKIAAPFVETKLASFTYANGAAAPNTAPQPTDQPFIKSTGVLSELYIGSDPSAYSSNVQLANVSIFQNGDIYANGDIDLSKTYANGAPVLDANGNQVYGFLRGDGSFIKNIPAAALSGATVDNANYASYAGNITRAAQANITSVGTLTSLDIAGNMAMTGSATITGNVTITERMMADVLVANTFVPDTVNAQVGMVSPVFSTGSNITTGYLTGHFVLTAGSFVNFVVNDAPLYTANISTGTSGTPGNFHAPGAGGGWTFDERLTLLGGVKFDDGTGGTTNVTTSGSTVNMFRSALDDLNFGTQASNITMGATPGGATTTIKSNVFIARSLTVDEDINTNIAAVNIANTTSTTVNFAGAGTIVNIAAPTGTTTIKNSLTVDGNIAANANINALQTTISLLNANATTIDFAGAGTTINVGSSFGNTNINNDLYVMGGNIFVPATATSANIVTTNATTVSFASAADTINIGNSNASGTTTIKSGVVVGSQTTQNLWNTTATTINFGNAATTINMAKSNSVLNLRASTVVGTSTQTTVNLWNANTTTINFGGAADAISIGNTSSTAGNTTINHGLVVTGKALFNGNVVMDLGGFVPATASSAGIKGQIAYDASYVYICIATNTWKRAALASW